MDSMCTIRTAADLAGLPARHRHLRQTQRSTQCDDCLSTQVCNKFKRMQEDILPAPAL
jgi:hypothetical protein